MTGRYASETLALLRIGAAVSTVLHGTSHLIGWPYGTAASRASMQSLQGAASAMDCLLGIMLAAGLLTRPVALLLTAQSALIYLSEHATRGFWPGRNGGELALMTTIALLALAGNGPGAWAIDDRR